MHGPLWRHGRVSCCVNGVLHMTDRRSRSLHWSLCVLAFRDFAVSIFYCPRGRVAFWGMTLHCWVWQGWGQEPANVFLSLCTPLKVPYLTNFEALGFLKIPAGQCQSIHERMQDYLAYFCFCFTLKLMPWTSHVFGRGQKQGGCKSR